MEAFDSFSENSTFGDEAVGADVKLALRHDETYNIPTFITVLRLAVTGPSFPSGEDMLYLLLAHSTFDEPIVFRGDLHTDLVVGSQIGEIWYNASIPKNEARAKRSSRPCHVGSLVSWEKVEFFWKVDWC